MNSISPTPRKRNTPPGLPTWQDKITQAKCRVALLRLLVDNGDVEVYLCLEAIPALTKGDIKAMRDLKWIGLSQMHENERLYLKEAGRALLSAQEPSAGEGD